MQRQQGWQMVSRNGGRNKKVSGILRWNICRKCQKDTSFSKDVVPSSLNHLRIPNVSEVDSIPKNL